MMGTVEEEEDESIFWMELLIESDLINNRLLKDLMCEAKEILAIVIMSIKTARKTAKKT